ncbi:MAG: DUF2505 domain-containing protein [Nocardioidaceae bacterium]
MDVREEIRYDAAPDQVFEMLCDQAFREKVCRAVGSIRYDVSIERDGDTARVRNDRVMKADLPDFAKKVVGDTIEMVQTEDWGARQADGSRIADFHVEIPGKPGAIKGSVTLSPDGTGSKEVIAGTVKVSIPLVGKKLENEVAKGLKAALEIEGSVGAKWLAGDR